MYAVVDFGDGVVETLPLDKDHDYLYEVGQYVVHLQVKNGAIAFLDSQCPDHRCEQFGLAEPGECMGCLYARRGLPDHTEISDHTSARSCG